MSEVIMAIVFFAAALIVRRREAFAVRWRPDRNTLAALAAGGLAFAFSASILVVGTGTVAAKVLHYGGIYLLSGTLLPWGWVLLVERAGPQGLCLRRKNLAASAILGLGVSALFFLLLVFRADLSTFRWDPHGRATVVLVGAGGLFELFLYYGFLHPRLEKAFGTLPAILLTAAVYVAWHIGTQLPLERDIPGAVLKLFAVGVMYQSVFSMTGNLLVIWPLFHGVGVMIDFLLNIGDLDGISRSFPWAIGTLIAMAVVILVTALLATARKRSTGAP